MGDFVLVVAAHAHHRHERAAVGGFCALCPVNERRIAQPSVEICLPDHVIERRAVSKGGIFADRRVAPLPLIVARVFLAVGFKRGRVEGNQRRAGGLRPHHALDARMQNGNRPFLARDQATPHHRVIRIGVGFIPRAADFRHILRKLQFSLRIMRHKDDVAALEQRFQIGLNRRMTSRVFGLPALKEIQNRLGRRMLHILQDIQVLLRTRRKAFARSFRLTLCVHAQHISGIIAQKIRRHAAGTLHGVRQLHDSRALLALCIRAAHQQQAFHLSVRVQLQAPTDLHRRPALFFQLAPPGQRLIAANQRLQDHLITSQSVRSSTPFSSLAWKNIG